MLGSVLKLPESLDFSRAKRAKNQALKQTLGQISTRYFVSRSTKADTSVTSNHRHQIIDIRGIFIMLENATNLNKIMLGGALLSLFALPISAVASTLDHVTQGQAITPISSHSENGTANQIGQSNTPHALPNRTIPFEGYTPLQPPLPENRADAVANIALAGNTFDVRLTNETNALVTYEVIGHTQRRYLPGGAAVTLQNVPAPATITFVRQDDGFVEVLPVAAAEPGLLAVQLDEDIAPLDDNQGVLRIQTDGQVFLN